MTSVLQLLRRLREEHPDARISFVSGNFRVIHAGHVRLLRLAREMADILVVGVFPRNTYNAIESEANRLDNVRALSMVDHAWLVSEPLEQVLRALRPNFVVKGKEHENGDNPEADIVRQYGGTMVFSSGVAIRSELDALYSRQREWIARPPTVYLERHGINAQRLRQCLQEFQGLRVTVVGDSIVDEYIHCDPLGMSQEDPTLVVRPSDCRSYLGGAGIVAAHAARLGGKVTFASVSGRDEMAAFLHKKLREYDVHTLLFPDDTRTTTRKQRFCCRGKTLLRVNRLQQHNIDNTLATQMLEQLTPVLRASDLLIFSDFSYGCLSPFLVEELSAMAAQHGIIVAADSQCSSQMGDVSRFSGAHLLTPTEREARIALHDFDAGLVVLAMALLRKTQARDVIMTLGEAGILVQSLAEETDYLPALNTEAVDVSGAGDSLLAAAAMTLASGGTIWEAACLGSLAAGVQVSREGNTPLTAEEMRLCLEDWA